MAIHIRRRELIIAFGGAAVWPISAHAQQAANMPTIPDCLAVPNGSGYGSCMPDGLITVRSAFDPAETKARLLAVLKDKGVTVFADIPHAKGAAQAGLMLAYSDLVIFGKPDAGTPLMQAAPTAGIDLPMKALVWQDADGVAWLSYNDARWIAARHGIGGAPAAEALATALAAFAKHATER